MDDITERVSDYLKINGFKLAEVSRRTGIKYSAIYDSLGNKNRKLRASEFLAICEYIQRDPMDFRTGIKPEGR